MKHQMRDLEIRQASQMQTTKLKENMEQVKEALSRNIANNKQTSTEAEVQLKEVIKEKSEKKPVKFKTVQDFCDSLKSVEFASLREPWAEKHNSEIVGNWSDGDEPIMSPQPTYICPDYAKYILMDHIDKQRDIRNSNLNKITKDLVKGNWKVTNASIAFDKNGNLIDGQHRILACVNSGVGFKTFVSSGYEPETYRNIDRGASRNVQDDMEVEIGLSDILELKSKPSAKARLTKTISWLKALVVSKNRSIGKTSLGQGWPNSTQEQTELIKSEVLDNDTYLEAVKWFEQFTFQLQGNHPELKKTKTGRPNQFARYQGVASALIYYRVIQPESAYDFISKLYSGCEIVRNDDGTQSAQTLDRNNPVMRLRNKLLELESQSGSDAQDNLFWLTKKSIHKHFNGEVVKHLLGKTAKNGKNETVFFEDWKIPVQSETEESQLIPTHS